MTTPPDRPAADAEADRRRAERLAPSSKARFHAFLAAWRGMHRAAVVADQGLGGERDWRDQGRTTKDASTRKRYLGRYYRWLRPWWTRLGVLVLLGLVATVLDLVGPVISGRIVDVVAHPDARAAGLPAFAQAWSVPQLILGLAGVALAVILVGRLLNLFRSLMQQQLTATIVRHLRAEVWGRLLRLPLSDLHEIKSGGAVSRVGGDVDGTATLVQQAVLSPITAVLRLILVAAVLLVISWPVALAAIAIFAVLGGVYHAWISRVRPIYRSQGEDNQRNNARITEAMGGIRVVRSFAREYREELDLGIGQHTAQRKALFGMAIQAWLFAIWDLLMPLALLVVMALGAWLVHHGDITIGDVVTIQLLAFQALNPVFMIVQSLTDTQRSLAAMERVYEILDRSGEKPDLPDAQPVPATFDAIRFAEVTFAYGCECHAPGGATAIAGERKAVLHGVSIEIPAGSTVALVGASGSGKSTIADLLARFHDPSAGAITIGGIDLRRIRLADWRRSFGIVQQEVFLFDGTIADNIRYGRRDATDRDIEAAAEQANAMEFIRGLPRGLHTDIGERGVKLSGGQRQRLAIARAFLADPRILILDEATSSLDSASELLIQQAMAGLLKSHGRTSLVIAHRLSTIRNADRIIVLDHGRVVQTGTHEALMALGQGTAYHDMVRRQELQQAAG
jgi:ATP-binding cassette subfamily B protein